MTQKRVEPKELVSGGCYELNIFGNSLFCAYYDDAISRTPKCRKFSCYLEWNISGRVLKCEQCLKECNK